ncbi:MAG: hypothetical protein IPL54_07600 [Chitinophagaceae bacterium]|nr:hypothetical protein [Chitinophagaceae bacterium]
MADNTDEEHLDNPINNQSENPPDEITPAADAETINPNKETENMEVHHHAHNPAEPHHKKNWKSYFWEFLMLFLAVFCGFLAEYQLEHKIERDRELVYMKNMLEDLKKDTSSINVAVNGNRFFVAGIDTLLNLLSNSQNDTMYQRRLFITSLVNTYYYMPIQFSELTMSQLKYSGNFRLIRKHNVANALLQYEQGVNACKTNYDLLPNYFHIYESTNKELFNMTLARKAFKLIEQDFNYVFLPLSEIEKSVDKGKYLDKNDLTLFSKYYDDVLYYQTTLNNVINITAKQKSSADSLIQLIRSEYKLKE